MSARVEIEQSAEGRPLYWGEDDGPRVSVAIAYAPGQRDRALDLLDRAVRAARTDAEAVS